jgi:hypothetical protein
VPFLIQVLGTEVINYYTFVVSALLMLGTFFNTVADKVESDTEGEVRAL